MTTQSANIRAVGRSPLLSRPGCGAVLLKPQRI
jgi:hypothetical protein